MQFDPTIRLDFVATAFVVIFFVARLQSRVDKLTEDLARSLGILDKLEERVRKFELAVASHVGAHGHEDEIDG
jgi:hypothetical protein